ncbi:C-GCAxxG-C-C family protein [Maridesulfovibrio sp. FT414]|uniref:C-GCAxxG-C-C family protein n=1 Tax=Maridesulfovibrio sp. FT414 TaxID=2979469 RepID=UPI003D806BCE
MKGKSRCYFENGFLCAESVLLEGAEALNINNPAIPGMATVFCSGTSRTCGTCGAYQGALLLISLLHGRSNADQDLDFCYDLAQQMTDWFTNRFGSVNCYKITGCNFLEDEGRIKFREGGIKENVCYPLVEETAEFVINLLKENS